MPCACVLHLNRTREWWNEPFHITVVKEFYKWIKLSSSPFALFQFFLFFSFFFMSAMTENKFVTAVYKGNFMLKEWGNNKCLHSKLKFFNNYFAIKKFFVDFSSKKIVWKFLSTSFNDEHWTEKVRLKKETIIRMRRKRSGKESYETSLLKDFWTGREKES